LIRYLLKNRHSTPVEHCSMTFFVHAPAFVWWEWVRHRFISMTCLEDSFNLESGRYRELAPTFWVPRRDRRMVPVDGFKPARPEFDPASDDVYDRTVKRLRGTHLVAWAAYREMIADGVATEVARSALGFGVYYSGWVTTNLRNALAFLSLRTSNPEATTRSYPQAEIEECAVQIEKSIETTFPLVYRAFVECGRVAP
jgi:thymidylate synthase (FAD)